MEHLRHQSPLAATIYEYDVVQILDYGPEQSLHVFFRILGDLLELVDGKNNWFVLGVEIIQQVL